MLCLCYVCVLLVFCVYAVGVMLALVAVWPYYGPILYVLCVYSAPIVFLLRLYCDCVLLVFCLYSAC